MNLDKKAIAKGRVSVKDLFFGQFIKGNFCRMDTIVRYITIKEYYKNRAKFFHLYQQMQYLRFLQMSNEKHAQYCSHMREKFFRLIDKVKKAQRIKNPIEITSEGLVVHGSHRFALALYFGFETIPVKVKGSKVRYAVSWFRKVGFTETEIQLMEDTVEEIKCNFSQ